MIQEMARMCEGSRLAWLREGSERGIHEVPLHGPGGVRGESVVKRKRTSEATSLLQRNSVLSHGRKLDTLLVPEPGPESSLDDAG